MSKERAARRAEREAAATLEKEKRARERAKRERAAARSKAARGLVPTPTRRTGQPLGLLAERHRRRVWTMVGLWVLMQIVCFLLVDSWVGRGVVAVLTAFSLPVLWTLIYDRS